MSYQVDGPDYDDEFRIDFADPGGNSSLRAATKNDPRIHPCPTCEMPNRLTRQDVGLGYQCDRCADRQERGWDC
jgi:hypothetical protein